MPRNPRKKDAVYSDWLAATIHTVRHTLGRVWQWADTDGRNQGPGGPCERRWPGPAEAKALQALIATKAGSALVRARRGAHASPDPGECRGPKSTAAGGERPAVSEAGPLWPARTVGPSGTQGHMRANVAAAELRGGALAVPARAPGGPCDRVMDRPEGGPGKDPKTAFRPKFRDSTEAGVRGSGAQGRRRVSGGCRTLKKPSRDSRRSNGAPAGGGASPPPAPFPPPPPPTTRSAGA